MGLEAAYVNMDEGFVEAMLRTLRSGILGEDTYSNLKQVSNISEFKLVLEDSDYGAAIFENQGRDSSAGDFEVGLLRRAMKEKLASELEFMRSQAVYPLNEFIERMLHGYQIDNVVFMIEGLKSNRSKAELERTCDPLGYFKELKNIHPVQDDDYGSLYQNVLIDLPVGIYFRKFLDEITASAKGDSDTVMSVDYISQSMKDYNIQQIQLMVRKIWLNDFHEFCMTQLEETSRAVMDDFLKFEGDYQLIQIISNGLMVYGSNTVNRDQDRKKYTSKVGYLYPDREDKLKGVSDFAGLVQALDGTMYADVLKDVSSGDDRNEAESSELSLDDAMLRAANLKYSLGFEGGFHCGCFFSYLKLKEQEIKNVTWLAELI